jgi:peptide methionine sulfoxide reductase MsrA
MKKIICAILLIYGGTFVMAENIQETYLAGGCFWAMEVLFEETDGVQEVISGFAGRKDVSQGQRKVVFRAVVLFTVTYL